MTTAAFPEQKLPVTRISAEAVPAQAFADIVNGARLYRLWSRFAIHDIRQRFRRSVLGPFWLTISMGTMIGTLGFLFSVVFRQDVPRHCPLLRPASSSGACSRAASLKAQWFSYRRNPTFAICPYRSVSIFIGWWRAAS